MPIENRNRRPPQQLGNAAISSTGRPVQSTAKVSGREHGMMLRYPVSRAVLCVGFA